MIGAWLMALCALTGTALALEGWQAYRWHHRHVGEQAARAEYARLRRDAVDSAESRLSEAEFIRYYVNARPAPARYLIAAAVLLIGGLPVAAWVIVQERTWP